MSRNPRAMPEVATSATALARTACVLALRETLLDHPPVFSGRPFTLALVVPADLRKDIQRAYLTLIRDEPVLNDVDLAEPVTRTRGGPDYSPVQVYLRTSTRLIIFLDRPETVPPFVVAAADAIIPIRRIDADVLTLAFRTVEREELALKDANSMASYPIADVLAAARPGRSAKDVLLRLAAAHEAKIDRGVPPVEALAGYGDAAIWAGTLVAELAAWKRGELPWTDLDAAALLSGPPGVGKTLFARALAKSCGCTFIDASLAQWQSTGHLGDLLSAMRASFKKATDRAPAVLLIDEFDSVGDRSKFSGPNAQYTTEVVAGLLECLDGAHRREGVVVVGACNNPERIDSALLRPGRLGRHFRLSLPDAAARKGIIRFHIGDALDEPGTDRIVAATAGFTGADIGQLAADARRRSRTSDRPLRLEDVLSCLPQAERIVGEMRRRVCVHEAGHAAAILALDVGRLSGVVVMDEVPAKLRIGGGAIFEREARLPTSEFYRSSIVVQLAGMAAEVEVFGTHLEGAGGRRGTDLNRAADIATTMIAQLGMGGLNYVDARDEIDLEQIRRSMPDINRRVEQMLTEEFERARAVTRDNLPFINELADLLDVEGRLAGDRVAAMFAQGREVDAG